MEQFKLKTENNLYSAELAPILLKGSPMSSSDAGFCSGSSDNGDDLEHHPRSPTSDDSIDVKISTISLPSKNKRKSSEPLRMLSDIELGPIKKRIKYQDEKFNSLNLINNNKNNNNNSHEITNSIKLEDGDSKNPFRPWAGSIINIDDEVDEDEKISHENYNIPNPAEILLRHPGVTTLHRSNIDQEQPLALVSKKSQKNSTITNFDKISIKTEPNAKFKIDCNSNNRTSIPIPVVPSLNTLSSSSSTSSASSVSFTTCIAPQTSSMAGSSNRQCQQRNYKNMTRERRIEANARERTRVHTISAAYDTLRKSIPSYSNNQKLSKLSILRISCQYILLLSRIAGLDYSPDNSEPPISECMDGLTKTIQTEGKLRKKKDE